MKKTTVPTAGLLLLLLSAPTYSGADRKPADHSEDVLLTTMQEELRRAQSELGKLDPAPYYVAYTVYDQEGAIVIGGEGTLVSSTLLHQRTAEVNMRIGSPALDNTHEENRASGLGSGLLPLANDRDAIAHVFWQLTYEEYRKASKAYLNVKTANAVRTQSEDTSPDFSQQEPQTHLDYASAPLNVDPKAWADRVRRYSAYFRKYPEIYSSKAIFLAQKTQTSFVSSEGTRLVSPTTVVRLMIEAETRADDGMDLLRVETFQAATPDRLPKEEEIASRIATMAADLKALRAAPVAEPFNGPALLSGRAAAVFFHEVLGHRLEGHRQRGEEEGQTFTRKVNQSVLPEFLSVTDDPTQRSMNGLDLSGFYQFDDEGVPAGRVEVIKAGILKSFLMSRMPVKGFDQSNGHGRAQAGLMPTGGRGI